MDRILGLELGADDYLPKPFEPRELLARLKSIIRRGPRNQSTQILRFNKALNRRLMKKELQN